MNFYFRIHSRNIHVLQNTEITLRRILRSKSLDAKICQVADVLEHERLGLSKRLPALECNGSLLLAGRDIDFTILERIVNELAEIKN